MKKLDYAIRLVFGLVHAIFITLVGFGLALLFPSLTTFMFGLIAFILLPAISLGIGFLCNLCILYVSRGVLDIRKAFQRCWYPAAGIFIVGICVMPFEITQVPLFGDMNMMFGLFLIGNAVTTSLLQVYSGLVIQEFEAGAYSGGSC